MTKRISKLRNKSGLTMSSSAAILVGALFAHQVYAQNNLEESNAELTVEEAEADLKASVQESMDSELPSEEVTTLDATEVEASGLVEVDPSEAEIAQKTEENTNGATETAIDIEEVVVYGIKQSLMNAQDMKRDAATVMDVVTASDITSLPDKSVVDALTRVPGVTVEVFEATDDPEHFGAEGSTALVRGLNRTLTQFNGRTSFSATKWGALNLSHIPSELVGAIEVQKNQTASMIEGGIAGTLNLVTRKPFDSPGRQLGGSVKVDYSDTSEQWSPNITGLFSDNWDTDYGEFGFLVSLSLSEASAQSEAVGAHDYYEKSNRTLARLPEGDSLDGVGTPIPGADPDSVYWMPPSIQARAKEDSRERIGFASSIQWRSPDENVLATLEFIRSDGQSIWNERLIQDAESLGYSAERGATPRDLSVLLTIPGYSGLEESFNPEGIFTHGVLSGANYAPETRYHQEDTYVNDISLDIEWNVNDNLTLSSDLQYVDSGQIMFDHTIHSSVSTDVWLDLRDEETPQVGFLGPNFRRLNPVQASIGSGTFLQDTDGNYWGGDVAAISDPKNSSTRSAMDHNTDSAGDALAFAVDADYEFEDSWVTNIKTGVRISRRDQLHKETGYEWGSIAPEYDKDNFRSVEDYPQFQHLWDFGENFHDGDALAKGGATAFFFPKLEWVKDLNRFQDAYSAIVPKDYDPDADRNTEGRDDDPTWQIEAENAFVTREYEVVEGKAPGSPFAPYTIFDVNEKTNAAYVQMDFDFVDLPMPIRGNVGLRYVEVDVTTRGHRIFEAPSGKWIDPKFYDDQTVVNLPDNLKSFLDARRAEAARALLAGEEPVYASTDTLEWLNDAKETSDIDVEKFTDFLPSLNLTVNLTEDLLLRFGVSKAIYTPHLSLKRVSQEFKATIEAVERLDENLPVDFPAGGDIPFESVTFIEYSGESVGGSNPYLAPEESINTDLGLEWYFADVGSVSGVVFQKDMSKLIRKGSTLLKDVDNPLTGVTEDATQLDTYYNVGEAQISGIELSYQQTYESLPGIWSGLGVQMNYTYLDTSEDISSNVDTEIFGTFTNLPLEGLSPESYNFIIFFEAEKFNTRLAYNFRSEYMLSTRDVIGKRPVYNADRAVLDYSFTYNFMDNLKLGFDINNITNEQTRTLYQHDAIGSLSPRNFFVSDRRFTMRLSGSY